MVNRLSGWFVHTASSATGRLPVSMDGTADSVRVARLELWRYQVASSAKAVRFGNRAASISSSASSSDRVGSSSRTTRTTEGSSVGALDAPGAAADVRSAEAGDTMRNDATARTGRIAVRLAQVATAALRT